MPLDNMNIISPLVADSGTTYKSFFKVDKDASVETTAVVAWSAVLSANLGPSAEPSIASEERCKVCKIGVLDFTSESL